MERINNKDYPAKRLTLKERLRFLVYQTDKDYILKPDTPEDIKRMIQQEFPFIKELDQNMEDNTDDITKDVI